MSDGYPKVYAIEDRVLNRGRAVEIPSLPEARAEIIRLCTAAGVEPPTVKRGRRGSRGGWYAWRQPSGEGHAISLGSHAPWATVWHEAAHAITDERRGDDSVHHGPEFVQTFVEVVAEVMPPSYARRLAKQYGLPVKGVWVG